MGIGRGLSLKRKSSILKCLTGERNFFIINDDENMFFYYNFVNNQKDATTLSFINSISTVTPVGSSVGVLYQKLYIQSKSAPEDGRICRPKHVGLN